MGMPLRLTFAVHSARNLPTDAEAVVVDTKAAPVAGQAPAAAKGKKEPAKPADKNAGSAVVVPHAIVEVDGGALGVLVPPSKPVPIVAGVAEIAFQFNADVVVNDELFDHVLTMPLKCRVMMVDSAAPAETDPRRRLGEALIDLKAFFNGEECIEGWFPLSSTSATAEIRLQISLSDQLCSEFDIEQNVEGSIAVMTLSSWPSLWTNPPTPPAPHVDPDAEANEEPPPFPIIHHRFNYSLTWPIASIKLTSQSPPALVDPAVTAISFPTTPPRALFLTAAQQATLRTSAPVIIDVWAESAQLPALDADDPSAPLIWIINPIRGRAQLDLQSVLFATDVVDVALDLPVVLEMGEARLSLRITMSHALAPTLPRVARRPIGEIVPAWIPAPIELKPITPDEQLRLHLSNMIEILAEKYTGVTASPIAPADTASNRAELVFRLNRDGVYYRMKEALKAPIIALASQMSPPIDHSPERMAHLYEELLARSNAFFASVFSRDSYVAPVVATIDNSDELERKSREASLLFNDAAAVRYLGERALIASIDTPRGVQTRMDHIRALLAFGALDEATDLLYALVAHHQDDRVLRRALACALLEGDAASTDAADLLRLDVETIGADITGRSVRAVALHISGRSKTAQQNLKIGRREHADFIGFAVESMLSLGLAGVAQQAIEWHRESGGEWGVLWEMRQARAAGLLRQWDRSVELCQVVLAIDGDHRSALCLRGEALLRMGLSNEAASTWERLLLSRGAVDARSCAWLGRHYCTIGQFVAATHALDMAVKADPHVTTWRWFGEALEALDKNSDALDALIQANLLNRYDSEVWEMLTLVCLKIGRVAEALRSLEVLDGFAGRPSRPAVALRINDLLAKRGRPPIQSPVVLQRTPMQTA